MLIVQTLIYPVLLAVVVCAGCANPSANQQSSACPPSAVASAYAPVSCGPTGWQTGGVVTNAGGNGPHVELWGPPSTAPTGRE